MRVKHLLIKYVVIFFVNIICISFVECTDCLNPKQVTQIEDAFKNESYDIDNNTLLYQAYRQQDEMVLMSQYVVEKKDDDYKVSIIKTNHRAILEHLNNPESFSQKDNLEWSMFTNPDGLIIYEWNDSLVEWNLGKNKNNKKVLISRNFDNDLGKIIYTVKYKSEKKYYEVVKDDYKRPSFKEIDLKKEKKNKILQKAFTPADYQEMIHNHVLSSDPHNVELFDNKMKYQTKTNKTGSIILIRNKKRIYIQAGNKSQGITDVVISKFYCNDLKEWIYKSTYMNEQGKEVSKYFRIPEQKKIKSKNISLKQIAYPGHIISNHVISTTPHNPSLFSSDLYWQVKTEKNGKISFKDNNKMFFLQAAPHGNNNCEVTITRLYSKELKQWIYKSKGVDKKGDIFVRYFQVPTDVTNRNSISLNIFKSLPGKVIMDHLKSEQPHDKDNFDNNFSWETTTTGSGMINYEEDEIRFNIQASVRSKGICDVTISKFYSNHLQQWVYQSSGVDRSGQKFIRYFQIPEQQKINQIKKNGKGIIVLSNFLYYDQLLFDHILSDDLYSQKNIADDFEWNLTTNKSGKVLSQKNKISISIQAAPKDKGKCNVKITRFFSQDLNNWIYKSTGIDQDGKLFVKYFHPPKKNKINKIKEAGKGTISLLAFSYPGRLILELVMSKDPDNPNRLLDDFKWQTETTSKGLVTYTEKGKQILIQAVPPEIGRTQVEIKPFFNHKVGKWIYNCMYYDGDKYKVQRVALPEKENIKQSQKSYILSKVEEKNVYRTKQNVLKALSLRDDNTPYALISGKNPDLALLSAARLFKVKLPEINILDEEYNRESLVASIKFPGMKGFKFIMKSRREVYNKIKMYIREKVKEKNTLRKLIAVNIKILQKILTSSSSVVNEFLGVVKPAELSEEELNNMSVQFFNGNIQLDPWQSSAVKIAIHKKTKVTIIQGGAGSGKTTTLAEIAMQLSKQGKNILIVSNTNTAVDNLLLKLDQKRLPIKRVYSKNNSNKINTALHKYWIYNEEKQLYETEGETIRQKRMSRFPGVVTGVTVDSLNMIPETFNEQYDTVIIDEAGMVNEVDAIITSSKAKSKLILGGDHTQLEPFYNEDNLKNCLDDYKSAIKNSTMLLRWNQGYPQAYLARNYRSHPVLAVMIGRLIYNRMMVPNDWRFMEEDTLRVVDVKSKSRKGNEQAVIPIDKERTKWKEKSKEYSYSQDSNENSVSYWNQEEAKESVKEFTRLRKSGYRAKDITFISGYNAQVSLIREKITHYLINKENYSKEEAEKLASENVVTVDSYQGKENDVVIYSFVRSNAEPYKVGHIGNLNRLNVSLSRSKDRLIVLGDMHTLTNASLTQKDLKFAKVFDELQDKIWKSFELFWHDQKSQGFYTIREAIQMKNGFLSRKLSTKQLNFKILKQLEQELLKNESDLDDGGYELLEKIHEMYMRKQFYIYNNTSDYEYIKTQYIALSYDLPGILQYDEQDNSLTLNWLNSKNNKIFFNETSTTEKPEIHPFIFKDNIIKTMIEIDKLHYFLQNNSGFDNQEIKINSSIGEIKFILKKDDDFDQELYPFLSYKIHLQSA